LYAKSNKKKIINRRNLPVIYQYYVTIIYRNITVMLPALRTLVWLLTAPDRATLDRTGPVPDQKWLLISLQRLLRVN